MIDENNKAKIKVLAKEMYAEDASRDEFVKRCESFDLGVTDETAGEVAQELAEIWAEALIEAENLKLGKVVKDILLVLSESDVVTHAKTREEYVAYANGLASKVLTVLTDSGLRSGDAVNALNSALAQVNLVKDEVVKAVNAHAKNAFAKVIGKALEALTLKEISDLIKDGVAENPKT